jgi:hypothetical protein
MKKKKKKHANVWLTGTILSRRSWFEIAQVKTSAQSTPFSIGQVTASGALMPIARRRNTSGGFQRPI